jgi:hypothetical protein
MATVDMLGATRAKDVKSYRVVGFESSCCRWVGVLKQDDSFEFTIGIIYEL